MESPCKAWFIGGPKDCEYMETDSFMYLKVPAVSLESTIHMDNPPAYEMPNIEIYHHEILRVPRGRREHRYHSFYLIEGTDLDKEVGLAAALLLYTCNPETLNEEGLEVAKQLPRDVWPDRRRPAKRLAAFTRLFRHRLYKCAVKHRMF